jgi:hypothetical protein
VENISPYLLAVPAIFLAALVYLGVSNLVTAAFERWRRTSSSSPGSRVAPEPDPAERVRVLGQGLVRAGEEIGAIVAEINATTADRAAAIERLQNEIAALDSTRAEYEQRLDAFGVSPALLEYLEKRDRESGRRDVLLFAAGVALPLLVALVDRLLGWRLVT